MKKMNWLKFGLPALLCVALLLVACNNDNLGPAGESWMDDVLPTTYIAVGTVQQTELGAFYFLEDDSTSIFPKNFQTIPDALVGRRVWFEFYKYLENKQEPGYDMTAHVFNLGNYVLTKPCFLVTTEAENDSIGSDPATVSVAWMTGNYLHVVANYAGAGVEPHYINLVRNEFNPATADEAGKINLEFRHNNRNEAPLRRYVAVVSFDVSDFFPADGGSVTLCVTYKPDEQSTRSFEVTLN